MKTHQTKIVVIKWKITQMLSQYFINLYLTRSQFDVNHFWSFVNKCENYKRLRVEFPTNQLDVVFGVWSLRVSLRSPDGFASLLWTVSKKDFNVLFRTKSVFRIVCFFASLTVSLLNGIGWDTSRKEKDNILQTMIKELWRQMNVGLMRWEYCKMLYASISCYSIIIMTPNYRICVRILKNYFDCMQLPFRNT